MTLFFGVSGLEPTRMRWENDQVCRVTEDNCVQKDKNCGPVEVTVEQ